MAGYYSPIYGDICQFFGLFVSSLSLFSSNLLKDLFFAFSRRPLSSFLWFTFFRLNIMSSNSFSSSSGLTKISSIASPERKLLNFSFSKCCTIVATLISLLLCTKPMISLRISTPLMSKYLR